MPRPYTIDDAMRRATLTLDQRRPPQPRPLPPQRLEWESSDEPATADPLSEFLRAMTDLSAPEALKQYMLSSKIGFEPDTLGRLARHVDLPLVWVAAAAVYLHTSPTFDALAVDMTCTFRQPFITSKQWRMRVRQVSADALSQALGIAMGRSQAPAGLSEKMVEVECRGVQTRFSASSAPKKTYEEMLRSQFGTRAIEAVHVVANFKINNAEQSAAGLDLACVVVWQLLDARGTLDPATDLSKKKAAKAPVDFLRTATTNLWKWLKTPAIQSIFPATSSDCLQIVTTAWDAYKSDERRKRYASRQAEVREAMNTLASEAAEKAREATRLEDDVAALRFNLDRAKKNNETLKEELLKADADNKRLRDENRQLLTQLDEMRQRAILQPSPPHHQHVALHQHIHQTNSQQFVGPPRAGRN